jgi:tetratricopeptide (TPR) repeat protein
MAKVSLRSYNQEIETMVENGQLVEAIAHCRHILNTYPKSLETYRLLGKAYLESKSYDEALNIFQRVVMAMPGDFVAHVGMSIINDERNKLDDAIWHMERAFESQPSNAAIQAELQRLYGRRDGVEPPKIRLTRGALAHMYLQGELYPQAISEITSVLEDDPDRQDMQVLLARAYFHSGQKSEAAEVCSRLLLKYPYNLDANRILVELLPETERTEGTQIYRHRINELVPYTAFATGSVFRTSEVPDGAVSLERLEWQGQSVELEPGWDTSQGVGSESQQSATPGSEEKPAWLKAEVPGDDLPKDVPMGEPVLDAKDDSQIPDFLREAGWTEGSGASDESDSSLDTSAEPEPEIERADLPDWIKEMAPEGVDVGELAPGENVPDDSVAGDLVPDWLQDLGDEESEGSIEESGVDAADDLPDWLGQAEQDSASPEEEPPAEEPAETPVDLNELGTSPGEQDDAVAWLESLAAKHGAKPEELVSDPTARTDVEPEWVKQAKQVGESIQHSMDESAEKQPGDQPEEEPVQPVAPSDISDQGTPTGEQDNAIAWLENLEAEHETGPEVLDSEEEPASGETEPTETPVEFEDVATEGASELEEQDIGPGAHQEPVSEEPVSEETQAPADFETLGTSAEEQEDAIAWLEKLAEKHGAKPEELVTDSASRKDQAPDWVLQASETAVSEHDEQAPAGEDEDAEPAPVEEQQVGDADLMEQAGDVGESDTDELEESLTEEPTQPEPEDATGMWLKDLGDGGFDEAVEPESTIDDWSVEPEPGVEKAPEGVAPGDETPEWVHEMEESVAAQESDTEEVDVPDWLSETVESEPPTDVEELPAGSESLESQADELPDWLAGLEDSSEPAGAAPSDEIPEWIGTDEPEEPGEPEESKELEISEPSEVLVEPLEEEPVPTAPDEWKPVDEQDTAGPEPQTGVSEPQPAPETPDTTEVSAERTISPATNPALNQARTDLSRGNIPAALEEYKSLIKKGKLLDETIFDLREALYRYPVEVSIWQTLGDAYMRENRLQDALDAYTKAEELLR